MQNDKHIVLLWRREGDFSEDEKQRFEACFGDDETTFVYRSVTLTTEEHLLGHFGMYETDVIVLPSERPPVIGLLEAGFTIVMIPPDGGPPKRLVGLQPVFEDL